MNLALIIIIKTHLGRFILEIDHLIKHFKNSFGTLQKLSCGMSDVIINFYQHMNSEAIKAKMVDHLPILQNKQLSIERLSGLTNVTYAVYVDQEPLYIFKTFSDGFDREMENRVVQALSEFQLSPRVIYASKTYRIEAFLANTKHPSNSDLNNISLIKRIMQHMYVFHQVQHVSNEIILTDYIFSPSQRIQISLYKDNHGAQVPGNALLFQKLYQQVSDILVDSDALALRLVPEAKQSIRLCHNDLNNLNILFQNEKMHFIDYDYVGMNYLAFDIANFINETTIDYSIGCYPGFRLLKLFTYQEIKTISRLYPGYYPQLDLQVCRFMCIVNLYWAIWSLKRYSINKSVGFGVAEHGTMRIQLFKKYYNLLEEVESRRITDS